MSPPAIRRTTPGKPTKPERPGTLKPHLNLYANDVMGAYADNSGSIAVTIKRIE